MLKIIIVDDHPLARMAIRTTLEGADYLVVAECEDSKQALTQLKVHSPDIFVMDIDIPGLGGIELVRKLRKDNYLGIIIMVSAKNQLFYSPRSASAGANAFISKKSGLTDIISAIKAAQNGYSYFPFIMRGTQGEVNSEQEKLESLSEQEFRVLNYLIIGVDNTNIADNMSISSKTVSTYKTRLMEKLNCNSLVDLLSFARRNSLG